MDSSIRSKSNLSNAPIDTVAAYTVLNFCNLHGISKAAFYEYRKEGIGPDVMKVCGRTLISAEAARDWREKMTEPSRIKGIAHAQV